MALARCTRCGKIASTAARVCPHCAAARPTTKPTNLGKLAAALAGTGAIALGVHHYIGTDGGLASFTLPRLAVAAEPSSETASDPRELQRLNAIAATTSTIRQSVDNPHSLVWETILADDEARVICLEYRVKNRGGEYVREFLAVVNGRSSGSPDDWNRHCAGKPLHDMIRMREAV